MTKTGKRIPKGNKPVLKAAHQVPDKSISTPAKQSASSAACLQIIGIGASAGGLEALQQFLKAVPADSGLAFVIVQHLDPTRKALMAELLQRSTDLPVSQIVDRTKVEPNRVYVIPPNRDLSILKGKLHLFEPAERHGLRLPIDSFFRSLAADQQEKSIAVILSGMGSDGTLGIRAIKEHAGTVFVQSLDSAKFDGMPQSAINSGLTDIVAPAEELVASIISFRQHLPLFKKGAEFGSTEAHLSTLEKIILILRNQTGHDFSGYKTNSLSRRIERRTGLHKLAGISEYVLYLRKNPAEVQLLFKELLIGVTSFFRDPKVWDMVSAKVIPKLLANHPNGGVLRAWVPGCSTGEEAYSLAIAFQEALDDIKAGPAYSLQIFATDLDEDAITQARGGVYPANIAVDVNSRRLRRFFNEQEGRYLLNKQIRDSVIFAPQNLVMDPPFTKIDFLSCRNLLIYLEQEIQQKLLPLFHYSLNPGGVLLLGSAESIGSNTRLFSQMFEKSQLFLRRDLAPQLAKVEFPTRFSGIHTYHAKPRPAETWSKTPGENLETLTAGLLLQHFSPASVLVTDSGDIVHISGRTGKYLEPAVGKANMNIFSMARDGLSTPLNDAFTRAMQQKTQVTNHDVDIRSNGHTQRVDLTVKYLEEPEELQGMVLVVFADSAIIPVEKTDDKTGRSKESGIRLTAMAKEVQQSRDHLQAMREEMQTSQEELKSSNEELQSTNEELQSTNEELTTSKEEMQSMNEELQTINHELEAKLEEFSRSSDDMKNLLNSSDIAILFLDNDLMVRRYTTRISSVIKLIPSDIGRPFTDLAMNLHYTDLVKDALKVLNSLQVVVRETPTYDERIFNVRIMPYIKEDNRVDGVVMTFSDITEYRKLVSTLQESLKTLQDRLLKRTGELQDSREVEKVLRETQRSLNEQISRLTPEIKAAPNDLETGRQKGK